MNGILRSLYSLTDTKVWGSRTSNKCAIPVSLSTGHLMWPNRKAEDSGRILKIFKVSPWVGGWWHNINARFIFNPWSVSTRIHCGALSKWACNAAEANLTVKQIIHIELCEAEFKRRKVESEKGTSLETGANVRHSKTRWLRSKKRCK